MGKKGVYSPHNCLECGETDPSKFFKKQKTRCGKCQGTLNEKNRVQQRIDAINYKGGKCEHCGYNKYHGALEFHHKDPTQKEPKNFKPGASKVKYLAEIDKCVLLCSNCHREEHARLRKYGSVAESG